MIRRTTLSAMIGLLGALAASLASVPATASEDSDPGSVTNVLARESTKLDSLLSPESIIPERPELDSRISALDAGNFDSLAVPYQGSKGLKLSLKPGRWSTYNRVEGFRISSGLDMRIRRGLRFEGDVGYATAAHRWVGQAGLTAGKRTSGPAARLEAFDRMQTFGPNESETGTGFLALVAGQDRQDYLRRRQVGLWVTPVREREGNVWFGAWQRDDRSALAKTDFHLLGGGTPMELQNPAVDEVEHHGLSVAGSWSLKGDLFQLDARADLGIKGSDDAGDYAAQEVGITIRPIVPGGTFSLSVDGRNTAGSPPVQEEPYLGGDGNLRGYDRLEITGRRRLAARVEYEFGMDLLERSRIPLLKELHLQFIPFLDIGSTWGTGRGVSSTSLQSLDGESRSSFGLGLRRNVWLPGVRAVRLDVIRRADGADDPIHFWFRFIPY